MVRVIIADDEVRICQLIIKLIEWEKHEMCLVGTAHNGVEALALVEKEKPDIVITDIRMPGCDGLEMIEKIKKIRNDVEFIIISGYGEFEYAKKAIALGVQEYLLKPINQNELLKSLMKVITCVNKKNDQIDLEKDYVMMLKDDVSKTRQSFLNDLMFINARSYHEHRLCEINETYHFNFREGLFGVACIKIDQESENGSLSLQNLMDEMTARLTASIQNLVYEGEVVRKQRTLYLIMNYSSEQKNNMEEELNQILEQSNQMEGRKQGFVVTIAIGEEKGDLNGLVESLGSASQLVEDRIVTGRGSVIMPKHQMMDQAVVDHLYHRFSKKFIPKIEHLDLEGIERAIGAFKKEIEQVPISGAYLKQMVQETLHLYEMTMKSSHSHFSTAIEHENVLIRRLEQASSVDELFEALSFHITTSISAFIEDGSRSGLKSIRQAKKYIEENYMNQLTLEEVGTHIGFNACYFSSVFKKETGSSFVEYLSKTRIEKAKALLKESDLRILDVSLMVGYNDVKYFTKSFKKHTGLQPNEYRKIFS
ncbi:response regulator transcription factor [Anoxynatronum buryatiense]|uniref:Stage 0 sporulation protein A homolog n=1 Tax=Anoxynatronum buryatiense TaxID=489973 RepID=A0AA45WYG4_9CLOT|nr:response regulator [Anoxynatronum buryatiense]SMP63449.1 two-component system, response regulator YesN [Anoxynatronum buryatiense]